ncbi:hypothetical protein [Fodinicola feengrottensis]|uniref:Uncharacterized protein n=1 Tax=Fodinicola feengrottensis TaxID=435914 RepID=A0ABN2IAN3_9ACTN|nr:hypothetical protein [Fodinicola feengrottensis]
MSNPPIRFGDFMVEVDTWSNGIHIDAEPVDPERDENNMIGTKEQAYMLGMALLDASAPTINAQDWRA